RRARKLWPKVVRTARAARPHLEEPEPRPGALAQVLGERRAEHERLAAALAGKIASGARVRGPPGNDPDRARWAIEESRRSDVSRVAAAELPRLRPDERVLVFARRGDQVEAWVGPGPRAHLVVGEVTAWRAALDEISRQVRDAEGWPDS